MSNIDLYIESQDEKVRIILKKIRAIIHNIAPEVNEKMGYGMPGFYLNGPLIYFAAFKNYVGLYPTPSGVAAFKNELSVYKTGKGTIQFPLEKQIPFDLIEKIVKFRVKENLRKNGV